MSTWRPLDATSGHDATMAEVERLCTEAGAPEAAAFYSWSGKGLWRVPDGSEPRLEDIGSNRDDMQSAVEMDVAAYLRLRERRAAIGGDDEPAWSLVMGRATKLLLDHAGIDPAIVFDMVDFPGSTRSGMRVDHVTHSRGCVLAHVEIGHTSQGEVSYDAYQDRSEIRIRDLVLPETVMVALQGITLSNVMPHPVLDRLELPILRAETVAGWRPGDWDTILLLAPAWQPLMDHDEPRPWLMPLPLPRYA